MAKETYAPPEYTPLDEKDKIDIWHHTWRPPIFSYTGGTAPHENEAYKVYRANKYTKEEEEAYRVFADESCQSYNYPDGSPWKDEGGYWLKCLKMLATPDQMRIIMLLPGIVGREDYLTKEQIAEKLGMEQNYVNDILEDLIQKSLVLPGRRGFRANSALALIKDGVLPISKWTEEPWWKELTEAFCELYEKEYRPAAAVESMAVEVLGGRMFAHPYALDQGVEQTKGMEGVTKYDDIRYCLNEATELGVEPCACLIKDRAKRDCGKPENVCLQLNRNFTYNHNRGVSTKITKEQALDICLRAWDWGCVPLPSNQKEFSRQLCNCHVCTCCDPFSFCVVAGLPIKRRFTPSRFRGIVDPQKCTGCQECIKHCTFGSIEMKHYDGEKNPRHPYGKAIWKAWIDPEVCMGSGCCVVHCPEKAIHLKVVRPLSFIPDELPPRVLRFS